jgi:hypothetical protein
VGAVKRSERLLHEREGHAAARRIIETQEEAFLKSFALSSQDVEAAAAFMVGYFREIARSWGREADIHSVVQTIGTTFPPGAMTGKFGEAFAIVLERLATP